MMHNDTTKANFKALKNWMDNRYFVADQTSTVTCGETTLTGYMYGNDECFDGEGFYQYLLTADAKLYKAYYDIPDDESELDSLDYDHPCDVVEQDA